MLIILDLRLLPAFVGSHVIDMDEKGLSWPKRNNQRLLCRHLYIRVYIYVCVCVCVCVE